MFAADTEAETSPNREQQTAIDHDDGPLLIVAGAGTGKTGTLAMRVAKLLNAGAIPERMCLLTFSRRAAREMLSRAARMAPDAHTARVCGGTFHSVAVQVLRHHGRLIGVEPSFTVMDQSDTTDLLGFVRHDLGLDVGNRRFPGASTLASIYGRVVNAQERLADVVATSFPWCAKDVANIGAVFESYVVRKRAHELLDFDDLLLCWRGLGLSARGAPVLAAMFDHVLVDEYQDTNALQADILAAHCPSGRGLTVVGDDAQAIYGFRAASAEHILAFPTRYPGAEVVCLEQNYRSTTPILAVANEVLSEAEHGYGKTLWTDRPGGSRPVLRVCSDEMSQADGVCMSVLSHREDGIALRDQAVLFRASHHADVLELALTNHGIPFVKYGGLKFLSAAHVKDLLALLRLLENPRDELAWFRVLRLLEGVGPATARRIMDELGVTGARAAPADTLISPLARLLAAAPTLPGSGRVDLEHLRQALADCSERRARPASLPPIGTQVGRLRAFLTPLIERRYDRAKARVADLEQLEEMAARFPSRDRFITDLTVDPPVSTGDLAGPPLLDEDWLVLSTVHSAKGGEWEVVHVIHAADGMFPSDMATGHAESIEEERRLFYVALTRARRYLEISMPMRYYHRRYGLDDAHGYAQLSRFLSPAVRAHLDRESPVAPQRSEPADNAGGDASPGIASIDTALSALWA